jgi:DNA repair protein RadC
MKTVTWQFSEVNSIYPELNEKKIKITSPRDIFDNFAFLFTDQIREKFVVFWLSSSNVVTGFEVISTGLLNSSLVAPREVFMGSIASAAASIILAHNHPSGNEEPSSEDISITKQLCEGGKLLGINVFDHIIFADDKYTSFVERRLI